MSAPARLRLALISDVFFGEGAAARLRDNNVEVETHVHPGLGHGIDEAGVQIGMKFLRQVLADD